VLALLLLAAGCNPGADVGSNPPLADDAPRVVIETQFGNIVVGLYEEHSPLTVANFLAYVEAGFYEGTVFHRVMPGFMIQGGGYVPQGDGYLYKDRLPPIALESDNGLKNLRGTVSMARLPTPADSASSEFFVNLVDNQRLDRLGDVELGYAVFGVVLEGMDVVDAIAAVETTMRRPFPEPATPVEHVFIRSVRRRP
jgi:cyclophilin family peptidyl-prolyl cis-trans isomerase